MVGSAADGSYRSFMFPGSPEDRHLFKRLLILRAGGDVPDAPCWDRYSTRASISARVNSMTDILQPLY